MRKTVISIVAVVVLLSAAVGGVKIMAMLREDPAEQEPQQTPAILVRTLRLTETEYRRTVDAYGTVRPNRTVVVSSEVSGEVKAVSDTLRPGNLVGTRETLVRIDDEVLREQLAAAQARFDQASAQLAQLDREQQNIDALLALSEKDLEVALKEERRLRQLALQDRAVPESAYDQARLALHRYETLRQALLNRQALLPTQRQAL